jgi:GNAT superfamily N-acetyltransferase
MTITFRNYNHAQDYWRVDAFLIRHYQPHNRDGNWIEPAWEYMNFHGLLDSANMGKFGIWEDDGEIVAVVHYEWHMGEAFFQFHPAYRHLRREMLDYAEANLLGRSKKDGRKYLLAYVNDNDEDFLALVKERGYQKDPEEGRPMAKFAIPKPFPPIALPPGYRLQSLADECNWAKVHRVLWRGFNHGDLPPITDEDLEDRRKMFETPNARLDLKIVTIAPDGEFASFCGMFYEPDGKFAYVEPVATDPAHRRLGLGGAAVLEGIRRCAELGAEVAYVGSNQPFYLSLGFEVLYTTECWIKFFDE